MDESEKSKLFEVNKLRNFKESCRLEGIDLPDLPLGTTMEDVVKKHTVAGEEDDEVDIVVRYIIEPDYEDYLEALDLYMKSNKIPEHYAIAITKEMLSNFLF